jgi:PHD/YefM family antitoxin component YafN of YafNO toxin-antitoxin module
MKAMKLTKELEAYLKLAEAAEEHTLLFTAKKKPVAALVSLRNVDRESLLLSTNPHFMRIIAASRNEIRAGRTVSLEKLEANLRHASSKRRRRSASAR